MGQRTNSTRVQKSEAVARPLELKIENCCYAMWTDSKLWLYAIHQLFKRHSSLTLWVAFFCNISLTTPNVQLYHLEDYRRPTATLNKLLKGRTIFESKKSELLIRAKGKENNDTKCGEQVVLNLFQWLRLADKTFFNSLCINSSI